MSPRRATHAIRAAHGQSAACGRLTASEVTPWDETAKGVHGEEHAEARGERTASGRWTKASRTAQSAGGRALKNRTALATSRGFADVVDDARFNPYRRQAADFRRAHCRELAQSVGGGICGAGPSSMVASAALALAASRFCYDTANGDADKLVKAARLGTESRAALRDAHQLCALEAEARAKLRARQPLAMALRPRDGGS